MTLIVAHGNGHNKESLVRFVKNSGADSAGGNEGGLLVPELRALEDYRHLTYARGKHQSCDFVCVRKGYRRLGVKVLHVHDDVPNTPGGVGNMRFIVGEYYEHPIATALNRRGIFHIEVHPVAGPNALKDMENNRHPLVVAYRKTMQAAKLELIQSRRLGFIPILTGDLQIPKGVNVPWAPEKIADEIALDHRSVRIDWLWHDKLLRIVDWDIVDLYDHKAFIAKLRRR